LSEHKELGQTYNNYCRKFSNRVNKKRNVIYIQPFEEMPEEFNKGLLAFCQAFYTGLEVRINKKLSLKK
jgi:hypothetical protein